MDILQPPLKIVQYPHPALRHPAKPLTAIDRKVVLVAEAMLELMYEHRGLGLAAPQVGLPFQMFVTNYAGDREQKPLEGVYINPVIVERRGTMEGEEGCLSFPQLFQKVRRAKTVRVQAYNLQGQLIEGEFSDLPARIWQHETDHLHAILFIDKFGPIGKLAARGALREFEHEYRKSQERGEIPPDPEIEKRLDELEGEA
ncbi:MAG: peptide deformylase [Gemmataceae bacterium]